MVNPISWGKTSNVDRNRKINRYDASGIGETWRIQHKNALYDNNWRTHNKTVTNIYSERKRFVSLIKFALIKYFWCGASERRPSFAKKKMNRFTKQSINLLLHSDSVIFWCEATSMDAFVWHHTQRSNYNAHPIIICITQFSFTVHTAFKALTGDLKMIFAVQPLVDKGADTLIGQ